MQNHPRPAEDDGTSGDDVQSESASDRAARLFATLAIIVVAATLCFVAWSSL